MWVLGSSLQVVQQALLPAETFCCPHCDLILVFRLGSFSRPDFHFSGPFLANQAHCCHPENIVAFISLTVLAPGKFNPLISSFVAYIPSSYLPLCFCNHLCFLKTIISVLSGNSYVSITPKNQVQEHVHAMPVILIGAQPLASLQDTTPSFDPTELAWAREPPMLTLK